MLPCGSTTFDYLEANKENLPLDKLARGRLVLPVDSQTEEIDVVTVAQETQVLLTPCMSQSSGTSTMSPGKVASSKGQPSTVQIKFKLPLS